MRKARAMAAALAVAVLASVPAGAQEAKKPPYYASIASGEALMRAGPGKNFPGIWLYKRADLPIKVIETYPSWRKVQDPGGTVGWMLVGLLSDTRTGIVTGDEPRPMRAAASDEAPVRFHAEPGVVGRLSDCSPGWCRFDVGGRTGYIARDHIWGIESGETVR
jgi:SH3-like domain-containing protein